MKKIILSVLSIVSLSLITGCESFKTTTKVHEHNYNVEEVDEAYLASNATCEEGAKYYYSCVCGEYDKSNTFISGPTISHTSTSDEFFTTDEKMVVCTVPSDSVGIFKKCDVCNHDFLYEIVKKDSSSHTHIAHEYNENKGICAICGTEFNK